jgi:hypothetical protein
MWRKCAMRYAMKKGDFDSEYKIAAGTLLEPSVFNRLASAQRTRVIVCERMSPLPAQSGKVQSAIRRSARPNREE